MKQNQISSARLEYSTSRLCLLCNSKRKFCLSETRRIFDLTFRLSLMIHMWPENLTLSFCSHLAKSKSQKVAIQPAYCRMNYSLSKKNTISLDPQTYKVGEGLDATPIRFFQSFKRTIYSNEAETFGSCSFILYSNFDMSLVCPSFFDAVMATIESVQCRSDEESTFSKTLNSAMFSSFLLQIAEIHKFVYFVSILL